MSEFVGNNAVLQCAMGTAPSALGVLPINKILGQSGPLASIMDHKPFVNIKPFGMCTSLANPAVLAATVAALGVLTPMPCIPATIAPWVPGSVTNMTPTLCALNKTSTCMCMWGGAIKVLQPGQQTVMVKE